MSYIYLQYLTILMSFLVLGSQCPNKDKEDILERMVIKHYREVLGTFEVATYPGKAKKFVDIYTDVSFVQLDKLGNVITNSSNNAVRGSSQSTAANTSTPSSGDDINNEIAPASLFDCLSKSPFPRRSIIEGEPGMSKTTVCMKLCLDWVMKKDCNPLRNFKLVFLITLRNLNMQILKQNLVHIVINLGLIPEDAFDEQDIAYLEEYIKYNPAKVCIIFDGYDELKQSLQTDMLKYWTGALYRDVPMILTTRPKHRSALAKYVTNEYYFILQGLQLKNRLYYIQKHLTHDGKN